MADAAIGVERRGRVVRCTLDRPPLNLFEPGLIAALRSTFEDLAGDATVGVVVLTGSGRAFTAGMNVNVLRDLDASDAKTLITTLHDALDAVHRAPFPVIAAINGAALGGGCFLAISCDLCVAAEHASFALTEARVGRAPIYAFWLNGIIPQKVALEMSMTGNPIGARRAYELGLVNHVVPAAELMDKAMALAADLCAAAPLSIAATKAMLYETAGLDTVSALELALARFKPVFESEDAMEGMRAFREKRPPQ
jgi:enoyl-CoA hydratase